MIDLRLAMKTERALRATLLEVLPGDISRKRLYLVMR